MKIFARTSTALLAGSALVALVFSPIPAFGAEGDAGVFMQLEGRLIQVAVDHGDANSDPTASSAVSNYEYAVLTEAGMVPIAGEVPSSADYFSGTVTVPDAVVEEVSDEAAAEIVHNGGVVADDSFVELEVQQVAGSLGLDFPIASANFTEQTAESLGSFVGKSLYIAVVAPAGLSTPYTDIQVNSLSSTVRSYWVNQAEGAIPSFAQTSVTRYTSNFDCSAGMRTSIWNEAAFKFSSDPTFFFNGNGRHLAIFLPQSCASTIGGGVGTVGDTVDEGGILHVTVGATADTQGLAHEIGHNLSLGHSNLQYCPSSCSEPEYHDVYDVMGISFSNVQEIPALNSASKVRLGFIPDANVATLTLPAGVATQTTQVNLKSIAVRNVIGTRVVQIFDPVTNIVRSMEYRSGTGDDVGAVYSSPRTVTFGGNDAATGASVSVTQRINPGVRLLSTAPDARGVVRSKLNSWWNTSVSPARAETASTSGGSITVGGVKIAPVAGAPAGTQRVDVTLTRAVGTATISGRVSGPGGAAAAGVCVTAFKDGVAYAQAVTGSGGNYTMMGVPAHTSYLIQYVDCTADANSYEDRWYSNGDTAAQAVSFDVSNGQTVTGKDATLLLAGSFVDVRNSHVFFSEIEWMFTSGISTGTLDGAVRTYKPADGVSRQAMAAFLYRAAGSPTFSPPVTPSFTDVPSERPFYKEIEWMKSEGISTGTAVAGGFAYAPGDGVSRQAMSAFLYRFAGSPSFAAPGAPTFTDVPTDAQFYQSIEWMSSTAITTGYDDGGSRSYRPLTTVSRAAMAAFLNRFDALP